MFYQLHEKMFSLGEDFIIQDNQGNNCLLVNSKHFSIGEKLVMRDMRGQEIARIEQKMLSLRPTFTIWRNGYEVAAITKHMGFMSEHLTVNVAGAQPLEVRGNLSNHEYAITRAGQPVATISKRWFSLRERYGVEVQPGEDAVLILACAIAIDLINDRH